MYRLDTTSPCTRITVGASSGVVTAGTRACIRSPSTTAQRLFVSPINGPGSLLSSFTPLPYTHECPLPRYRTNRAHFRHGPDRNFGTAGRGDAIRNLPLHGFSSLGLRLPRAARGVPCARRRGQSPDMANKPYRSASKTTTAIWMATVSIWDRSFPCRTVRQSPYMGTGFWRSSSRKRSRPSGDPPAPCSAAGSTIRPSRRAPSRRNAPLDGLICYRPCTIRVPDQETKAFDTGARNAVASAEVLFRPRGGR